MKKIIFLLMCVFNYAQAATPVLVSTNIGCANKYCMTTKGLDFDADASVQVRENAKGSTITVFAGNDIYGRGFTTAEDKMFFPIQNLKLQEKWKNNGLCFRVNNNGILSNEICNIRTQNPIIPNFMGQTVESYNTGQDLEHTSYIVKGDATPLTGGNLLKLMGNSWKQINFDYTVTAYTVLKFDFRSNQQEAEINGIGFRLANGSVKHFQVYGTQETWENQDYNNYSGTDFKTYEIPVGEYFDFNDDTVGSKDIVKMFFSGDEDNHVGQNTIFKNPRLVEQPPLNFDCDQDPLPEKIDCPNDEFFSLGDDPKNDPFYTGNPEDYAKKYQWAADYMDFAYGWYYTRASSRVTILDSGVTLTPENSQNLRTHASGIFASVHDFSEVISGDESQCKQVYPWSQSEDMSYNINNSDKSWGEVNKYQTHLENYPNVFINEIISTGSRFDDGDASIEVAIKVGIGIDINNSHLQITNSFDENSLIFTNSSPYSLDDFVPRKYDFNTDFNSNYTTALGYRFYKMDKNDTSKPLIINSSLHDENYTVSCNPSGSSCTTFDHETDEYIKVYKKIKFSYQNIMEENATAEDIMTVSNIINYQGVKSCERFTQVLASYEEINDHGSLILGLLGSTPNNNIGTASFCRDCSLSYLDSPYHHAEDSTGTAIPNVDSNFLSNSLRLDNLSNSIQFAVESGNQIINYSGGLPSVSIACEDQENIYGLKLDSCNKFEIAYKRDIVFIASAGNHLDSYMQWPANSINHVIGVTGTNPSGNLWIRDTCLNPNNTGDSLNTVECGSNIDPYNLDFSAPAEDILVFRFLGNYNPALQCFDGNFLPGDDGYQRCSGTSFSAPIMSSVVAMIRSINPLISIDNIKQILKDSRVASLSNQNLTIPRADKSVKITLGKSNRNQIVNRLTPMFRMKTQPSNTNFPNQISYLSTTIPQVAVAAKFGTYLVLPDTTSGLINQFDRITYKSDLNSPTVAGYNFKTEYYNTEASKAPFFVFGGHRNPFNNEADDLLPLYHMARAMYYGGVYSSSCTELADHAYSTVENNGLLNNDLCAGYYSTPYVKEGIDGYILPSCPNGVDCYEITGNANDLQCLKLRYSVNDNSFGLMMASEVNESMFQNYKTNYKNASGAMVPITGLTGMSNAECLGYVFPNVDTDSDGIIDGMELVLGTDPNNSNTDGDKNPDGTPKTDGQEYPLAGIPVSDPLIVD